MQDISGKNGLRDLEKSLELIKKEFNKFYNLLIILKSLNLDTTFASS